MTQTLKPAPQAPLIINILHTNQTASHHLCRKSPRTEYHYTDTSRTCRRICGSVLSTARSTVILARTARECDGLSTGTSMMYATAERARAVSSADHNVANVIGAAGLPAGDHIKRVIDMLPGSLRSLFRAEESPSARTPAYLRRR